MFYVANKDTIYKRSQLKQFAPLADALPTFSEMADGIINLLKDMETLPSQETWIVEMAGQTLHGNVCVRGVTLDGPSFRTETHLTLYFRTSYNNRFAPEFAIGAQVDLLGDNFRYFHGPCVKFKKRLTSGFETQPFIEEGVVQGVQAAFHFQKIIDAIKKAKCSNFIAGGICMVLAHKGYITHRAAKLVFNEWLTYGDGRNALDLYKSMDVAFRTLSIEEQFRFVRHANAVICEGLGVAL